MDFVFLCLPEQAALHCHDDEYSPPPYLRSRRHSGILISLEPRNLPRQALSDTSFPLVTVKIKEALQAVPPLCCTCTLRTATFLLIPWSCCFVAFRVALHESGCLVASPLYPLPGAVPHPVDTPTPALHSGHDDCEELREEDRLPSNS